MVLPPAVERDVGAIASDLTGTAKDAAGQVVTIQGTIEGITEGVKEVVDGAYGLEAPSGH
jgi:hypothetical protein